jgi:DNA end-binding protein Ku
MRAIWSGTISFGLVSIPIKLYSAIQHKAISFRLLHKKDNSPIKYKKFCEEENKEVKWEDIAKGIEIERDKYYVISEEEIEKLKPEKSYEIQVLEFIDLNTLDNIFFDNHYYIAPTRKNERAYFLFKAVLQSTGKIAIAKFVMREKEYICAISSYKSGLLLTTLNYQYEIREIEEIEELKSAPKLREEELGLANNLISQLYNENINMSKFRDNFKEQLMEIINNKEKGIKPKKLKKKEEENLLKALKASLK